MYLLIDWGNTYLKLLEVEKLTLNSIAHASLTQIKQISELSEICQNSYQAVLISSVRKFEDNQRLQKAVEKHSQSIYFAETSASACGVQCAYEQPALLGVDRWLGIIGASTSPAATSAIVSIGTAITLDIVTAKKHLGGQIIPGEQLLFNALKATGRVKAEEQQTRATPFDLGYSTTECVNAGIETLLFSYLDCISRHYEDIAPLTNWIFTGGGGRFWADNLACEQRKISYRPRIVFEGLIHLYNWSNSNS